MCVKVVLMMELLYEEKTLTYEEEVRRFFFGESYETSNLFISILLLFTEENLSN